MRNRAIGVVGLVGAAAAGLAYGWFEAGWLRRRVLRVAVPGLPTELEGLRIAHLSDFHLGVPSRGRRAVELAVDWTVERQPDLVCITGDLLSRVGGEPLWLEEEVEYVDSRAPSVGRGYMNIVRTRNNVNRPRNIFVG